MADIVYNKMTHLLATGALNMATADIRALLARTAYTPDKDHDFVNDITNEVSGGSGYVRKACTTETVTLDNTNDWTKFTRDAITWTAANFATFRYIIFYLHDAGGDSASALLWGEDLTEVVTNGSDLTITPHANGDVNIKQG